MKRNILKKYNFLIAFLISILGVGVACSLGGCEYGTPGDEYGTPSARFKVTGTVTSETNAKISNIRVVMHSGESLARQTDTSFTDINGAYIVQTLTYPDEQDFSIKFDDIDGTLNGIYQSKDSIVSFDNPKFINGDGSWYKGETSKELNIKLKAGS